MVAWEATALPLGDTRIRKQSGDREAATNLCYYTATAFTRPGLRPCASSRAPPRDAPLRALAVKLFFFPESSKEPPEPA